MNMDFVAERNTSKFIRKIINERFHEIISGCFEFGQKRDFAFPNGYGKRIRLRMF